MKTIRTKLAQVNDMHQDFSEFDKDVNTSLPKPLNLTGTLSELMAKIQDAISQGHDPNAIYSVKSNNMDMEDDTMYEPDDDYAKYMENNAPYNPDEDRDLWEESLGDGNSNIGTDMGLREEGDMDRDIERQRQVDFDRKSGWDRKPNLGPAKYNPTQQYDGIPF